MPINPAILIAAPILQDYFSDKDGTAMVGGTITCFHDNSRSILKNWYYQTGTAGSYSYLPLPNPLTLSSAGTITDINGVDTIPFFYPYSEIDENQHDPYYITIVNHDNTNQLTRANFPFLGISGGNVMGTFSYTNVISNNGFWRNAAPNTLNVSPFTSITLNTAVTAQPDFNGNLLSTVVAPSQHDGFGMPDIQFLINNTSTSDFATFIPFPLGNAQPIPGYIVPEYFLNHICTNTGSGVTQKCYSFPISLHVNTLANVPFTGFIEAFNGGGTGVGQNVITLFILQDTGTGTTTPIPIEVAQITLTPSWNKYFFTGVFPSTAGLTLGAGSDDALYLLVQMPLQTTCSVNFTKPSIFLNPNGIVPNNDFQTYSQVDSIIHSPRTGDVRISMRQRIDGGWVPMNNGTIGNGSSTSTARANADTWRLFNLLWGYFSTFYPGTTNSLAPILTSGGSSTIYGTSAISDFTAGKQITLTQTMGQVLLGTVPFQNYLGTYFSTFTASNSSGLLLITTTNSLVKVFNGMPIYFTGGVLPANLIVGTIYYVSSFGGANTFFVAATFNNAITNNVLTFAAGSGSVFAAGTGTFTGEYAHFQALSELSPHTHNPLTPGADFIEANLAGAFTINSGATISNTSATTGNVTGLTTQTAANVTQPGYFMNLFIKL
jgi:hypothetical protein